MSFIPFLQAGSAGSMSTSGGLLGTFIPFLLIIVIFYLFLIRPQNKKQKETQKMLDALKKGDKVITIGGIHGTVSSVELTEAEKAKLAEEAKSKKLFKGKKASAPAAEEKAAEKTEENK